MLTEQENEEMYKQEYLLAQATQSSPPSLVGFSHCDFPVQEVAHKYALKDKSEETDLGLYSLFLLSSHFLCYKIRYLFRSFQVLDLIEMFPIK